MAGLDKIPQALTKAAEKPKHFAVGGLAGTGPVRNRSDFGMVPVSVQMTSVGTPQRVTQQRQDVNEQGDLVIQFLIDDLQRNGPYNQARNSDQRYRRRGR